MNTAKKLLLTTTMALGLSGLMTSANAATTTIDASVITRPAVTVTQTSPMVFGTVDVDATTAAGDLVLHADDTINYPTGVVAAPTGGATPLAAVITIGTDGVSALDITCDQTGIMVSGGDSLNLSAVSIQADATAPGTADLGTETACTGALQPSLVTATAATVILKMGATIAGLGSTQAIAAGAQTTYDTTTGGTPVNFTVVYH